MHQVKGLLFDIGGVLTIGDQAIVGAKEIIANLQIQYPMRFITNTTRKTPQTLLDDLIKIGFDIKPKELFTALDASIDFIHSHGGSVCTVLTDEVDMLFDTLRSDNPDYVIIGDAYHNFNFTKLNQAFRALQNGAQLIAVAQNRYFMDSDDKLSLDAGGFIKALEYATNTKAQLIGKPNKRFFHLAVTSMELMPQEVLMIGDDICSDIQGAQEAGLQAALVKSGKFHPNDLEGKIVPDFILETLSQLPLLLKDFENL